MMTEQQRMEACAEALTWLNTPYHHHARIKDVGVDCIQLLCAVYAPYVIAPVDVGFYPTQWHLHRNEEKYINGLMEHCEEVPVPVKGDIALFKFGRTFSHSAIYVGSGLYVHAYVGRGVMLSTAQEEPLQGREVKFWRIK